MSLLFVRKRLVAAGRLVASLGLLVVLAGSGAPCATACLGEAEHHHDAEATHDHDDHAASPCLQETVPGVSVHVAPMVPTFVALDVAPVAVLAPRTQVVPIVTATGPERSPPIPPGFSVLRN